MILLDYSQTVHGHIAMELNRTKEFTVEPDFLRYMILNQVRALNVRFRQKYGQMMVIMDGRNNWRKQAFHLYKANRKKSRDTSTIDWDQVYSVTSQISNDIKEHFPMPCVQVDGCEADDLIAYFCTHGPSEPTLILSSDKDFMQLQWLNYTKGKDIQQYATTTDKYLQEHSAHSALENLLDKIMRGDKGDGVPNVLSAEDQLVNGVRATIMSKKRVEALSEGLSLDTEGSSPLLQCDSSKINIGGFDPEDIIKRTKTNFDMISLLNLDVTHPPEIVHSMSQALKTALNEKKEGNVSFYLMQHDVKSMKDKAADFYPS